MMQHLFESLKPIAWGTGASIVGTAIIAVYRGVRSLDAQLIAQIEEQKGTISRLETEVKASVPDIALNILGGYVNGSRILLKVCAVHRGVGVTVRDWTLKMTCKGNPWMVTIPAGLRVKEDCVDFEEPKTIAITQNLADILRSNSPGRGIAVEGWLLFEFAGSLKPELEDVLGATITLTAHDHLGGVHSADFVERPFGPGDEFGLAYGAILFQ